MVSKSDETLLPYEDIFPVEGFMLILCLRCVVSPAAWQPTGKSELPTVHQVIVCLVLLL